MANTGTSSVSRYFKDLYDAVTTIFEGMTVTCSHFVRKPYTIQYPDRIPIRIQDTLPPRYRGILAVDLEICTGCLACERACPIDCIVIDAPKDQKTKQMELARFDIDIAKCMYCGLCSEACPTGSIHHTTEFEGADYSLESLIRHYVPTPVAAYKAKKGEETDPFVAPILKRGMAYIADYAEATDMKKYQVAQEKAAQEKAVLEAVAQETMAGEERAEEAEV